MIIDPGPETLPDYNTAIRSGSGASSIPTRRRTRPSQPITYTFAPPSSSPTSETLVLPPPGISDRRPLYHIAVSLDLNPFLPVSYVTHVRRAGDVSELVAEFAFSLNQKRAILTMGDTTARISNVLSNINSSPHHWNWNLSGVRLRWDCRSKLDDGSPICICYSSDTLSTQLASFVPPPIDASPPLPPPTLTVFPAGHDCFDHIIVSALIVERRLTASF